MGVGPKIPAGVIVIGGGPSQEDVKNSEPLSGQLGRETQQAFDEAGIDRSRLFIVNAYACAAKEPRRDKEERQATNCCKPLLKWQLRHITADTPVMILGKWAKLGLIGDEDGVFAGRGFVDKKWNINEE